MKKTLSSWRWILTAIIMAAGITVGIRFVDLTRWPSFQHEANAPPNAPQVVAKVPRDFGWRTGDVIPIDLYIKQMPGTVIDTSNLAISGDFEIRTQPKPLVKHRKADGSTLMKLRFEVQSFNVANSWTLNAKLTYTSTASKDEQMVSLPAIVVYTSKTYDGRPDVQQGPQVAKLSIPEAVFSFGVFTIGLAGLIAAWRWRERLKRPVVNDGPYPLTPILQMKKNFERIHERLKSGDFAVEHYEELERDIRWLYSLEAKTRGQIEISVDASRHAYRNEIKTIVSLCDKRIYDKVLLTKEEHEAIFQAYKRIFTGRPSALTPWHR